MIVSLFKLAVYTGYPVDFLLKLLSLIRLHFNCFLHFVYLLLPLTDVALNLIHFLVKVRNGILLQSNLSPGLFDLILQAFDHHGLSFTTILCIFILLHLHFLTLAIPQFKLEKFLSLLSI